MSPRDAELGDLLRRGLQDLDVDTSPGLIERYVRFLRLLEKWNRAFNLTAVRNPLEMVPLHILDSLTARPFLYGRRIADVGTGAGLPGIPLAMIEPERDFVLIDSGSKKIRFVQHVIGELALGKVCAIHSRVQDYQPEQCFDTVICRAFSALSDFIAGSAQLLAPGGRLLAMKGRLPETELGSLPPGWQVTETAPVDLPGLDAHRNILVLEPRSVVMPTHNN